MATTSFRLLASAALVVLGACGDNLASEPDAPIEPAPDAGTDVRVVTLLVNLSHVHDGRLISSPAPAAELEADGFRLQPVGSGDWLAPTDVQDGKVEFVDVPPGDYVVGRGDVYVASDLDTLDLSTVALGRPDRLPIETSPTDLSFDVTAMTPWQDGDTLQVFSAGASAYLPELERAAHTGAPAVNDQALSQMTVDVSTEPAFALIDSSAGDDVIVSHLTTRFDGTHRYAALGEVFEPTDLVMSDGVATTLSGAFAPVAQDRVLDARWKRAFFYGAMRDARPVELPTFPLLIAHVLPEADVHGHYANSADTLIFSPGWTTDTAEVSASWARGDVYPNSWTRMITAGIFTTRQTDQAPDPDLRLFDGIFVTLDESALEPGGPIIPIVGPVGDLEIDGQSAYEELGVTRDPPRVSWSPPAVGAASRYVVIVYSTRSVDGSTSLSPIAEITTTDTALQIPLGIIDRAGFYLVSVTAVDVGGEIGPGTPFQLGLPQGSATATSNPIQVIPPDSPEARWRGARDTAELAGPGRRFTRRLYSGD